MSAEGLKMRNCVLLDSEPSADSFCITDLLETTRSGPDKLTLRGNGGDMTNMNKVLSRIYPLITQSGIIL